MAISEYSRQTIQKAGRGIAMTNAAPALKAMADEICGSNEEDGVAHWLESHFMI